MFVIPLRGSQSGNPLIAPATYSIIGINLVVALGVAANPPAASLFREFGFIPDRFALHTLLTSMFLHAGVLHLLGNMLFLWMFGVAVEHAIGSRWTLLLYLLSGLAGSLIWGATEGGSVPAIGASGAISGIVGAFAVLLPHGKVKLVFYLLAARLGEVSTVAPVAIMAWLLEQVVLGIVTSELKDLSSVAYSAHVGGLSIGALIAYLLRVSGASRHYKEMLSNLGRPELPCPRCGAKRPNRGVRAYLCSSCRGWFELDEEGELSVVVETKPRPKKRWGELDWWVGPSVVFGLLALLGLWLWVQAR